MVAPARAYVPNAAATRVVVDVEYGHARVVVPAGAYASVECWRSRQHYLDALEIAVNSFWRDALRRTAKDATSPKTFMRWARREAVGADSATGRGMRESVTTIARDLGVSEALVRRCRRIGRDLGIYRDIVGGRLLRLTERLNVYERGSSQRGVTGERAWCVTKALRPLINMLSRAHKVSAGRGGHPVNSATHPRRGPVGRKSLVETHSPSRKKQKKEGRSAARSTRRRLNPGERLARELLPRLAYGRQIPPRCVSAALAPFERNGWSPHQVKNALDLLKAGIPKTLRSPGGYLVSLLSRLDAYDENFTPQPDVPPKCALCDHHRWVELPDGTPKRCPNCHPLADGRRAPVSPQLSADRGVQL